MRSTVPVVLGLALTLPLSCALAADKPDWTLALGTGVASVPRYPGADAQKIEPIPLITWRYHNFFAGDAPGSGTPAGIGYIIQEDEHFRFGTAVGGDTFASRKERDDRQHLHGLGDIHGGFRAGFFASYTQDWFSLRGGTYYDLKKRDNNQGLTASIEAVAHYQVLPQLDLTAGPGVNFGNQRYVQTFFGVTAQQAQNSIYPEYRPKGGLTLARFTVAANYRLNKKWAVGAAAGVAQLQGDSARSPIVLNKTQYLYGVFVMYKIH